MYASALLIVTSLAELATGACLLILPSLVLHLLFGIQDAATEANLLARFAGAALVAFGIAVWPAQRRNTASGALPAALAYDLTAAALLAYAALSLNMTGIALWPGVMFHCGLAAWCIAALAQRRASPIRSASAPNQENVENVRCVKRSADAPSL